MVIPAVHFCSVALADRTVPFTLNRQLLFTLSWRASAATCSTCSGVSQLATATRPPISLVAW
jgi:hypothetical protein